MSSTYSEIDPDPYIAVSIDKLINGEPIPFDVFIKDMGIVIPLLQRETVYDGIAYNVLRERGVQNVYVKTTEGHELYKYLSRFHDKGEVIPDPETFKRYLVHKDEYYVIDRSLLRGGMKVNFAIHALHKYGLRMLLPATETEPLAVDDTVLNAPGDIAIEPAQMQLYHAYINALLAAEDTPERDKVKIKAVAIKENSKVVLKGLIEDPRSGEKIKQSVTVVNKMVDCILDNSGTISDLLSLRTHDYYTYTHSVNVAVLSVGLGIAIGLKRDSIEKLGIGAMLHDIGKSAIPTGIINKPGRLDDDEFSKIKTHVVEGEKILRTHKDIPRESFEAVVQHHERLTGRGYPYNRKGPEITTFGRITSIVDCYDALTTMRPYHTARTPFLALSVLTKEVGDYDADILKIFIRMLGTVKA
ncbi:MAG TPA: HD domain-containing phosphohydrolase [Nitrospirota bacterium]|nr:HD domain-containing phosphohydrolase [Nitrospirota bacterium]